ncbi:MAG TPA: nitroreductase family protein [Methanomicrobiales archaeon]|nr:nitroreductase family protein [Methanomicrobiales archaeon]
MNIGVTVIKSRRSIRKYRDTPIPSDVIHDALECARQAPTARNAQPWLFGTVENRETLKKIADLADSGRFIADARVCFAVFAKKNEKYYLEDGCAATMQLILGLWAHGVGSCWVAGDKKPQGEKVRKLLGVPETYTLVALVPAGYPADMPAGELLVKKKDLPDITFKEQFRAK